MKNLLIILGIIAVLLGALWIAQGTGYLMWPRSSFMLLHTQWAYYGACLAIIGIVMMIYALRRAR